MSTPTIWKFPLEVTRVQTIEMPHGAVVLSAGRDPSGGLAVWAYVDPGKWAERRKFYLVGTGQSMPMGLGLDLVDHIATVVDSPFVWHVFTERLLGGR